MEFIREPTTDFLFMLKNTVKNLCKNLTVATEDIYQYGSLKVETQGSINTELGLLEDFGIITYEEKSNLLHLLFAEKKYTAFFKDVYYLLNEIAKFNENEKCDYFAFVQNVGGLLNELYPA